MSNNQILHHTPLFNVDGDDSEKSIIGGNTTGVFNLNNIKYSWAVDMKKIMLGNFWLPEKVPMESDKTEAPLPPAEEEALRKTLSFLIFLDSLQVNNLPNLAEYITAPEIKALFTIQEFQELIHTESYQYIQEGLYDSVTREEIYYMWKDNPLLLKRNQLIANFFEDFIKNQTVENFKRAIIANFVLEGIYFYSGFSFFHNLAYRQKRKNTDAIIRYIKQDELTHVAMFANIINSREVIDVVNNENDRKMVVEIMQAAAEQEIEWAKEIYGSKIEGITEQSSEGHIKALTNQRLALLGMEAMYPGFEESPYAYLEDTTKANFFETTVTQYSRSETVSGWDDF